MTGWNLDPILESYALVALVGAVLLGLLVAIRPWSHPTHPRRQWVLVGVRTGLIVLLLLAMLRPTYVSTKKRPQSATLLVLYDQSRSMNVKDGSAGATRWQQLTQVLRQAAPQLVGLSELLEVRVYGFAQELEPDSFAGQRLKLPQRPVGEQTDLAAALHQALLNEAGKRLAGVILLSDGAQRVYTPQQDLQQVVRELARLNTPLYTVPFGKPREQSQSRDVAVERLQDQYTMFVKNELELRGALRVQGYVNQAIPVRVLIEGPTGTEKQSLGPIQLTAKQDDEVVDFSFTFAPQVAGAYRLRVEAKAQDGELVVANNEMTAYVNVLEGGLKVLYLDGNLLGAEQRVLRQSWAASADIELEFRPIDPRLNDNWPIDLSSAWQNNQYDVIVIGDVDSSALGNDNLRQIADLTDRGCGLLMLGGVNTLGAGGYRGTPLAEALPVTFGQFDRQAFGADEPIRPDVHQAGPLEVVPTRPHFTTHLAEGADNAAAWQRLNRHPLRGANRLDQLTPNAIRLADTQRGDPLLVARPYGNGRVMVFAADSTYLWWKYGEQELHKRFWRQLILWLANRDELLRRDVWVNLPRRRFRAGESIEFTCGARAENGDVLTRAELTAQVRLGRGTPRDIRLAREGDDWTAQLDELDEAGEYMIDVTARMDGEPIGTAAAQFQLQELDLELADPAANPQLLSMLAGLTEDAGGRTLPPENLSQLFSELQAKPPELEIEVQTKWRLGDTAVDSWSFFLIFVGLLGSEWFLRKKWGLN